MTCTRKERIAASFGARVEAYETQANLQREIARNLAEMLPHMEASEVLEIGCGTGFLTEYLLHKYPQGAFTISDLSAEMVEAARAKFSDQRAVDFCVMDGEHPQGQYDLIVSAMAVQWFTDPLAGLQKLCSFLKPGGMLFYATLGGDSFEEWRGALDEVGAPSGLLNVPEWPGGIYEQHKILPYESAQDFLHAVRDIGAGQPTVGYQPMSVATLRKACRAFDERAAKRITWHIVYGCLE